jgi:SPOR domain
VIKKQASGWSQPEMLNEAVNAKDVTSTHPQVVTQGDKEILYFSSNRQGGRGGMDIWYASRSLSAVANTFSNPVNLGPSINTLGDEMTPYFNKPEGTLYFSSNGLPGIGGFDIFSAKGDMTTWSVADNLGLPFNSSVDDYYYIKTPDGEAGFLVSNRIVPGEKLTTKDDDVFVFKNKLVVTKLEGKVFAQETGEELKDFVLFLYEIRPDGSESLILERKYTAGAYDLEVLPNRKFRVEITPPGYETGTYNFGTDNPTQTQGQPLMLKKLGASTQPVVNSNPPVNTQPGNQPTFPPGNNTTQPPVVDQTGTVTSRPGAETLPPVNTSAEGLYILRGIGPADKEEYSTNAPRYEGEYYKIQLAALNGYKTGDQRYEKLIDMGNLQTENLTRNKLTRVLLASFYTKDDAKLALGNAKKRGFPQAFIVRYINGERYGKVNL